MADCYYVPPVICVPGLKPNHKKVFTDSLPQTGERNTLYYFEIDDGYELYWWDGTEYQKIPCEQPDYAVTICDGGDLFVTADCKSEDFEPLDTAYHGQTVYVIVPQHYTVETNPEAYGLTFVETVVNGDDAFDIYSFLATEDIEVCSAEPVDPPTGTYTLNGGNYYAIVDEDGNVSEQIYEAEPGDYVTLHLDSDCTLLDLTADDNPVEYSSIGHRNYQFIMPSADVYADVQCGMS